jgi:spore coat polysaccharide biosynthesis protein SpsF (cytidylyltransferase family)
MNVVAIIQARMGSSRCPGKVLADVCGKPMIARVIERVRAAKRVDAVVLATSTLAEDDAIERFCLSQKVACVRGSQDDVLDRYYQAAKAFPAKTYVRITGDCPLHDGSVIDFVIREFLLRGVDYANNTLRYTFPNGLDTEVFTQQALDQAWREATQPAEREHVTPYLRLSGKFRTTCVEGTEDLAGTHRWSVDHPDDLDFVRAVYAHLGERDFTFRDVLELLERQPELNRIQKNRPLHEGWYKSLYQQALRFNDIQRFDESWLCESCSPEVTRRLFDGLCVMTREARLVEVLHWQIEADSVDLIATCPATERAIRSEAAACGMERSTQWWRICGTPEVIDRVLRLWAVVLKRVATRTRTSGFAA